LLSLSAVTCKTRKTQANFPVLSPFLDLFSVFFLPLDFLFFPSSSDGRSDGCGEGKVCGLWGMATSL
jgi:hypothetical protein